MTQASQLLQQYTAGITDQKKAEVTSASERLRAYLGPNPTPAQPAPDYYGNAAGQVRGTGNLGLDERDSDIRNLTTMQMYEKYGSEAREMIRGRAQGYNDFTQDRAATRSVPEVIGDTANDLITGTVNAVGGLGALGVGLVNKDAGVAAAEGLSNFNEYAREGQSDGFEANTRADTAINTNSVRDNTVRYEEDREKDGETLATLRRIGRNIGDQLTNTTESPTALLSGVAQGGGSLVGGGLISGALRAAGRRVIAGGAAALGPGRTAAIAIGAPRVADAVEAAAGVASKAAMPLAIGGMEAGGAYTGTVNEIMQMSPEELSVNSSAYREMIAEGVDPEEARTRLANRAGIIAGAIQAPVGVATGLLVSKFESSPLRVGSLASAATNIGRETIEEGAQSASGALATNFAIRREANENRTISEGVGEDIAQGALFGAGIAGAVQTPGAALKVTVDSAKLATRAAIGGSMAVFDYIGGRADAAENAANNASPLSADRVKAAQDAAVVAAPNVVADTQAAIKEAAPDLQEDAPVYNYLKTLEDTVKFDPTEAANEAPVIGDAIRESTDRFDAIRRTAAIASDVKQSVENRTLAGIYILEQLEASEGKIQRDLVTAIEGIEETNPAIEQLRAFEDVLLSIGSHPEVAKAIKSAKLALQKNTVTDISEEAIQTDTGQLQAKAAIGIAQFSPETSNPEVNDQILAHAYKGLIQLTPSQIEAVTAASELVRLNEKLQAQSEKAKLNTVTDAVSRQVKSDLNKDNQYKSAAQYTMEVLRASRAGRTDIAEQKLKEFLDFAQHMNNKVAAINEAYASGNSNKNNQTKFQARDPQTGEWFESQIYADPNNSASMRLAQQIALDAEAVTTMANGLSARMVDLNTLPIGRVFMTPEITDRNAVEIAKAKRTEGRAAPAVATKPEAVQATPVASEAVVEPIKEVAPKADVIIAEAAQPIVEVKEETKEIVNETVLTETVEEPTEEEAVPESESESQAVVTLDEAYPNLIDSSNGNLKNSLKEAFKVPKNTKSRLLGSANPIKLISNALKSTEALRELTSGELGNSITPAVKDAYAEYMSITPEVIQTMKNRITKALLKDYAPKSEPGLKTVDAMKRDGAFINSRRGKIANILEVVDDKLQFNAELLEGAVLAGMQWAINAESRARMVTDEDVARYLNKDVSLVDTTDVEFFNQGVTAEEAKSAIAQKIIQFWGLTADNAAPLGLTQGIPEAVAAEILWGLESAGLIELFTGDRAIDFKSNADETGIKTFSQVRFSEDEAVLELMETLREFPDAIEIAVRVEPEQTNFIGAPPAQVPEYQMRNRLVKNTKQDKAAIKNEQDTPHYANMGVIDFYTQGLGEDGVKLLYGQGNLDARALNVNDRMSLEGKNRTLAAGYRQLVGVMKELDNKANVIGTPSDQVPIYYEYNVSRVGRLHMLGKHNPQANKLMREAIMPTRVTMDLTDQKNLDKFYLAVAQAWGEKIHKQSRDTSVKAVKKLIENQIAPALEVLSTFAESKNALDEAQVEVLKTAFGKKLSPVAIHAAIEVARLMKADDGVKKSFVTSLYVEADGVTDGPINALVHMATGNFTSNWIKNVARGGLFIGRGKQTMNGHSQTEDGKADLYQVTTNSLSTLLAEDIKNYGSRPEVAAQMKSLLNVMDVLLPDLSFDDQTGELTLERGIVKNPLTVTIYGSGVEGIAGKLVAALTEKLYAQQSELAQKQDTSSDHPGILLFGSEGGGVNTNEEAIAKWDKLQQDLNNITNLVAEGTKNKGLSIVNNKAKQQPSNTKPEDYTLTGDQMKNLQQNMLNLFVGPMKGAIDKTIGETNEATTVLRKAIQVQSIFLQFAFQREIGRLRELKKKNDPNYKQIDFISQNEINEIYERLKHLSPLIMTATQSFFVAGSDKSTVNMSEWSRDVTDTLSSIPSIYGPVNAGVAGIPYLVIGPGDGQMMQSIATMAGRPEGTLKVFDGIHLRLTDLEADSLKVNQAVYDAWQGNPLMAVSEAYAAFVKDVKLTDLDTTQLTELSKALANSREEAAKMSAEEVILNVNALNVDLAGIANNVEARHKALAKVQISVDHMAGAESSYVSEGIVYNGLSDEHIANQLTILFVKEYKEISDKFSPSGRMLFKDLDQIGFLHNSGSRVITTDQLRKMPLTNIPDNQKGMMAQVTKALEDKGYNFVLGSAEQTAVYAEQQGLKQLNNNGNINGIVHGYTVFGDKTIYLHNASAETLLHEMIHAATLEKVVAAYNNEGSKETQDAVTRIEGLMYEWLDSETDLIELNETIRSSYNAAKAAIEGHLYDPSLSETSKKANALNEFMAWSLTNQELIRTQSRTKVKNPILRIARDMLAALRSMFTKLPAVKDDIFSNVQFNTAILLQAEPTIQSQFNDTVLYQSTAFGMNPRLSELRSLYGKRIASLVHNTPNLIEKSAQKLKAKEAFTKAINVSTSFAAHGFPMNMQELSTFRYMVSAFLAEAKLNPNSMSALQDVYAHVIKNVTVETFMSDPNSTDPNVRYNAQEQFDTITGVYGQEYDDKGRSTLMPGFLALAVVNEDFRQILKQIDLPKSMVQDWNTLDNALGNIGTMTMDRLSDLMSGKKRSDATVQEAIDSLSMTIASTSEDEKNFIGRYSTAAADAVDKGNDWLVDNIQRGSQKVIDKLVDIEQTSTNKYARKAATVSRYITAIVNKNESKLVAQAVTSQLNQTNVWTPVSELVTELIGRTDENADVYDMIKPVRSIIQQARQQFREELPKIIASKFSKELTEEQSSNLFKGMGKTDLAALVTSFSVKDALELATDNALAQIEISRLENKISANEPKRWKMLQTKAKELALYMNTGKVSGNLLRNAYAVSALYGEAGSVLGSRTPDAGAVKDIDQLITLYALQSQSQEVKDDLILLAKEEAEGVEFALSYLVGQRLEEQNKLKSTQATINHYKGYIPSETQLGLEMIVADDQEFSSLLIKGFKRVADYTGSKAEMGASKKGYYFSPVAGRAVYNQGIMQNVRTTASGVDPLTGHTYGGATVAGRITDQQSVQRITRARSLNDKAVEPLMPIYDANGVVTAYERSIDPTQEIRLNKNTQLGDMIGAWRGRQFEESMASQFNERLIAALAKRYKEDEASLRTDEYVDLLDPKEQKKDPIIADAASLITPETMEQIKKHFSGEFMVRKDMLNDAIGYRSPSVGDIFTGNTRWPETAQKEVQRAVIGVFGMDAYRKLVGAEKFYQNIMSDARVLIVVKSVIVPMANLVSNLYQLSGRGVPLVDSIKKMPLKTAEVDAFVKSRLRKIEVEAELRAATNDVVKTRKLTTELQSIDDANRRLSIWPLIEAGEFTSVSDGGLTREDLALSEGRLSEYMESLASKLPDSLRTAGRYALLTKDTALFRGLAKAIEYGDFLGKSILYDDLTTRKGMSPREALAMISEEFVNYDKLPGRSRTYLESMGLMWFWNYKVRIAKVALSMVRDNPLQALISNLAPVPEFIGSIGSPVSDNIFSVALDGRLDNSLGINQAMRAPFMNPWVQLFT